MKLNTSIYEVEIMNSWIHEAEIMLFETYIREA
jgi:hypothetical protein